YTYIQLDENVDWIEFDEKIEGYLAAHDVGYPVKLNLQPLKDIHLHSHYVADLGGHGDIIYVRIFSIIAAFILLIACINFMNLSTARAETRAREVGIKKVVGSHKNTLVRQFLGEAVILSFISLFFTIVMVELLLPIFNAISGKELTFFSGQGPWIYVLLLAITLFTGVFAGSYPAFILSSFKPINVLKGTLKVGKKGVLFRRLLVIIQFAITIIMIIGTLVVFKQVQFVHNKELGYTKEQILNFSFRDQTMESSTTLKNELLKLPQVLNVSRGSAYPYNIVNSGYGYDWRTKQDDERVLIHYLRVDYEFFETLDIKLAEGRTFSPDIPTDSSAIIINETAAALMGFDDPLSEQVTDHYDNNKAYNIIGVVKDFHFKKLQTEIEPLFISLSTQPYICFVRLNTEDIEGTLAQIKNIWNDLNPSIPFEYTFLDETYGSLYRAEKRMLTIFKYFTIMAIMISCLGLFGLISYMTQRRTREIGIRKVMGASVNNIVVLLTEESIKWVLIANIIAWPIAYFAMSRWLNTFVYKISLQSTYFILAGVLSMLIAIITISFQTLRAALRNPSEAMRYE
ncbi:MAG TPA: FtsX-like permease family protein, partial [Candidatus Cloacimonetes bacterium]|nr:FtsX-like permease family protein [Candidatus Cloacimonadota bacterium]